MTLYASIQMLNVLYFLLFPPSCPPPYFQCPCTCFGQITCRDSHCALFCTAVALRGHQFEQHKNWLQMPPSLDDVLDASSICKVCSQAGINNFCRYLPIYIGTTTTPTPSFSFFSSFIIFTYVSLFVSCLLTTAARRGIGESVYSLFFPNSAFLN